MNYLVACINSEYQKVLSSEPDILSEFQPDEYQLVDYTNGYKLDEDELFQINNFSDKDYFIDVCRAEFSTASLNRIENDSYSDISHIYIIQSTKKYFQRITPSLYINKRTVLDYSGDPSIVEHKKQIEIQEQSDAVYDEDSDTLYFKKLSKIKVIFPGIEILHRAATQPEVDEFLENEFIELDDYEPSAVGTYNRKRIADIGSKYKELSEDKQARLIDYAREKSGVALQDDSFVIDSEKSLKHLLYAMDQRYYTADIYEEERLANSVRVLS